MALALVSDTTVTRPSRTDTKLLKICRQYLLRRQHLSKLRMSHGKALSMAKKVLRDRPTDEAAAALWQQCWEAIPAGYLCKGIEHEERKLTELLAEIIATPAQTEGGVRARMQVWRTILAADDADTLLDSIVADLSHRRQRA
jgi:hypothetical protein